MVSIVNGLTQTLHRYRRTSPRKQKSCSRFAFHLDVSSYGLNPQYFLQKMYSGWIPMMVRTELFKRAKRIWRMALTLGAKRRWPAIFGAPVLLTKARSYLLYCKLPNVRISYQNTVSRWGSAFHHNTISMRRSNVRSHTVLVVATLLARSGSLVSGRHKGRNGALWALMMAHEASIIFSRFPG